MSDASPTADVNANDFPDLYRDLDIDVNKLGCVMLDVEPVPVTSYVENGEDDLYYSPNPDLFWIQGAVGESTSHITLLYGLLSRGYTLQILRVLDDWDIPAHVEVDGLEVFASPYGDEEPYSCIVARIRITPELREGRARLELLPHINTFLEWRAHVTLAYVRPEATSRWVLGLKRNLPKQLAVTGLNLGDQHD